ncbi:hypothetical protein QT711_11440 [Sporosarcina saromensis]|uniref:DUF4177 domain-containing protein n=1 Tax=Sporosarcina saromensis TaxID=359365 RepID=A0ABU4GA69_9BACL|nr:hypothetical protein [Sporosarcina saromensis]MDW0113801.1 hypothetical protein [Sporosarcina saromensis]
MKQNFIVRTYICEPGDMQDDMNSLAKQGYRPKEIKLDKYQNYVDAVIVYELEGDSNA